MKKKIIIMVHLMEFKKSRINMVHNGFRPNGITNEKLLLAFMTVERDYFVNANLKDESFIYENSLDLGNNRFLSNSKVYAKLLQEAQINPDDTVLALPLSCGYYSAILAHLAHRVYTMESHENLHLSNLGLKTATYPKEKVHHILSIPEGAFYDVIFIDGAVEVFPTHLWNHVTQNGRIVYVDNTDPDYFHGKVIYKNKQDQQHTIITHTQIPPCDLFRREHAFNF
jgi:protein-L-isoaspartate(D-aspartate) O-methyltransferase